MPATTPETRCRVFGCVGSPKLQRVEAGDRPRAHGEDVAQDAADAGRRALIGLDVARVVVALHLEDHGEPVADVDDAGILARPLDHPGRLGRQPAQMHLRGLVGAVLVPHRREDAELGQRRLAADQVEDALILVGLEPVLGDQFGGDFGFVGSRLPCDLRRSASACRPSLGETAGGRFSVTSIRRGQNEALRGLLQMLDQPREQPAPVGEPIAASTWFSGCGIMPSTLPRSLRMPAMALIAPLWFQFGSMHAVGRRNSGTAPGPRLPAARWSRRRRCNCLRHARPARGSPGRHCSRG